jgi:hypothetical protein
VLGVFLTPGWESVIPVGTAFGGALFTQSFNAWNKRGDRRHERSSDYEKRVWEAKKNALKRLISGCRFVKVRVQLAEAEETDEHHRRAATIRALDLFRGRIGDEDGITEVTAYAAEPVCKALDEMLEEVRVQRRKHSDSLSALRGIGTQLDALSKEPLEDSGEEGQQRSQLLGQRDQALDAIGSQSDLDVKKVTDLCNRVIRVAKKDLKGGYSE